MKLYSLTLNAIGPFAGEYSVDFAALGQSGLFLLEGPTGAGKSTIIDAIVFALYGGLAGESASKQRLMSHHAPAGARPFVDLTFEVESGIYRVVRTPAYQRPKKRGEGTTQQNETVKLTQLTDLDHLDAGQVVATTTQEVGHEIAGLIGLRKDQFLQTVVLPQGEFAKFLRSDGEQRKQLLESIFRTELYEQITGALGHMRREVKDVVASAQAAVRDAANILASAADVAPDHVLADDEVNQRLVDDLLEQTARQAADAAEIAEQARQAREQAHAQAEHARRAVQVAKRYVELLAERDRLVPQLHDIDLLRGHIELARKAAAVTGAQQAVQRSHEDRQACEAELAAAQLQWGDDDPAVGAQKLAEQIADLRRARDAERLVDSLGAQADQAQAAVDELANDLAQLDERAAARPVRREALQAERIDALEVADGEQQAVVDEQAAHAVYAAAQRAVELQQQAQTASDELAGAIDDARKAVEAHGVLRQRRIAGMAGELAQSLAPGEPCAVCGSTQHPQPAQSPDDHPDQDAIDAADQIARDAEATAARVRISLELLQADLATKSDAAMGLSPAQAQQQLAEATERVAGARAARVRVTEIDSALAGLDAEELHDERQRTKVATDIATKTQQVQALSERIEQARTDVERALGGSALSLSEELDRAQERHTAALRVTAALRDAAGAASRVEQAEAAFKQALAEQGFEAESDLATARMTAADLADAEQRVREFERRLSVLQAGLAEPSIAAVREQVLTDDDDPHAAADALEAALRDDEQANKAAREAAEAEREATGVEATTRNRADKVARCVEALHDAVAASQTIAADALPTVRVADIADGTSRANLKRLTLGTYVLMRRFEEVVAAANARLGPMSNGRFMLRASQERERASKARKTGLALAVYDAHTGQEREPRTLSGGETFYVSLCLALGLADIVTAEAGGIWIETLFVDEGFGTLDPATLDAVMGQLGALSRAGRTVGIVSHVQDLKDRVADRIEVRRLPDGSSGLTLKAGS